MQNSRDFFLKKVFNTSALGGKKRSTLPKTGMQLSEVLRRGRHDNAQLILKVEWGQL